MESLGISHSYNDIFKDKTVLITGHTGFKGSWLSIWLNELGANVVGYALKPYTEEDIFVVAGLERKIINNIGDIRDLDKLKGIFIEYCPEIVFHMAAQPLVRLSYQQPKLTYETNIDGTVNLLECCRTSDSVKVIINVTSDKCYNNGERIGGCKENDPLGGNDPYSSSKACSEIITAAYRRSFFQTSNIALSSVRAGNVIGGGDWREDRLVPDCIRALKKGEPVGIRSPSSVRPWQHVLEPLNGYLLLASNMYKFGEKYSGAWNFGPPRGANITVEEIVKKVVAHWGSGQYMDLSEQSSKGPYEANFLTLDISKAVNVLNWAPLLDINEAIRYTVNWYKKPDVDYGFCASQIKEYTDLAIHSS